MNSNKEKGNAGEAVAANFLRKKGYTIIHQNWQSGPLEIDIIAKDGEKLVIVEVKLRSNLSFGDPESFVKKPKHKALYKAADIFIDKTDWKGEVRFDIIAVEQNGTQLEITHFEDAFYPGL